METPKVSVVIPAFNAVSTIESTVNSVLAGTYDNFEILIIDDRSTDHTWQLINQIAQQDPRIKCYQNEQNYGLSKSRNILINLATGKYIAFLDSDDTWEPNKLAVSVKMLQENPDIKAVGTALRYLNKYEEKLGYISVFPTTRAELKEMKDTLILPWVFPSTFVGDREILLQEGGFREDWRQGEATDLFARIAYKYGILASKEPLTNYRLLSSSITDKKWLENRLADACVRENIKRMVRGEQELTLSAYRQQFFEDLPWFSKLNKMREFLGQRYKRRTGQCLINREYITAIFYAGLTTLLTPKMLINQFQMMRAKEKESIAEKKNEINQ